MIPKQVRKVLVVLCTLGVLATFLYAQKHIILQNIHRYDFSLVDSNLNENDRQTATETSDVSKDSKPLNVLFITADDLRPELGAYKNQPQINPDIVTPYLDKLASKSMVMKHHYAQYSLCNPSWISMLTGRRPDTVMEYDLDHHVHHISHKFMSMPQYFKENGYRTIPIGKMFDFSDAKAWSEPNFNTYQGYYRRVNKSWMAVSTEMRRDHPLPDDPLFKRALDVIKELKESQPFFLALGFHRPHVPMVFPKKYLQYYPEDQISLPSNPSASEDMPGISWTNPLYGYNHFDDIVELKLNGSWNTTLPKSVVLDIRRAYYASVTYMDSMVGRVLEELERAKLSHNTIVVFTSDHGFLLGEHGQWGKPHTFELANQVPLMIHIPGVTDAGMIRNQLTEHVDLFPTLVDAARLPVSIPRCGVETAEDPCHEGSSFLPILMHDYNNESSWKSAAFSQFLKIGVQGYGMRTKQYRYTEWVSLEHKKKTPPRPLWDDVLGAELYDHDTDPEENYNLANDKRFKYIRRDLSNRLHLGWREALP